MMSRTRRQFLVGAAGLFTTLALPPSARAALLTPRQPAGPFYPTELPLDDDNDLVQVAGQEKVANGRISDLSGRLFDRNGRPLAGMRIEIWQCDAHGRYRHPRDPGPAIDRSRFSGLWPYADRRRRSLPLPNYPPGAVFGAHAAHPCRSPAAWCRAVRDPAVRCGRNAQCR